MANALNAGEKGLLPSQTEVNLKNQVRSGMGDKWNRNSRRTFLKMPKIPKLPLDPLKVLKSHLLLHLSFFPSQ
ncbi:hypothetical protein GBA52_003609 [Prunus armeniaca]|nr:hypothetical protein GBA52_003609 [Prunus armeniaca]